VLDRAGRLRLVVGAAGGSAIPDYISQAIVGVLVDGLDPQAAINQGHWSGQEITSNCGGVIGPRSEVEAGTEAADLLDGLRGLHHPCARATELRSGSTAIAVAPNGLTGAADPRRDGTAVGG
jgi:gamma-glutamyltranspeptidase/glutathione hydrolase